MAESKFQNFGGLPQEFCDYKKSKIVILPIPFDGTSTYMKGADKGPKAIIEASTQVELYDIATKTEVYKKGIFTAPAINAKTSQKMIGDGYKTTKKFLNDNKFIVTLGGEHSISQGPIQAHLEHFPNLSILQLDAHSDLRDNYEGSPFNHACIMARVKDLTKNIMQVGIRSQDKSELKNIDPKKIMYAHQIFKNDNWIRDVIKKLNNHVYITFDLDVFDPSLMPATGTPEPGGLFWYQIMELIKAVINKKNLVGLDIVELCPIKNLHFPDFLTAKMIYQILSHKFGE